MSLRHAYKNKTNILLIFQDNMTMMAWLRNHVRNITIKLKITEEVKKRIIAILS